MSCDHGFIGACAECDGVGQVPEREDAAEYEVRDCDGCHEVTPVCCDIDGESFCAVCCPARPHVRTRFGSYERMDCDQ